MLSETGLMRLTGFLFLFILATSALSGGLAVELNADPDQIANTLHNIAEDSGKYRASITFDLVSHMAIIAIASALYLTFNKYNRQLALFGTLWRVVEGIIMVFTEVNNFVLLGVAQNFLSATGTRAAALETLAQSIILVSNSTNLAKRFSIPLHACLSLPLSHHSISRDLGLCSHNMELL